ncbi:GPA3 [Symbiodinium sp. CCMP2592]|nr:GPA3 [Symbiodinium sp. CCMP2592]
MGASTSLARVGCQRRARTEYRRNWLCHLGDELFLHICDALEAPSLGALGSTSSTMARHLSSEAAWRQACYAYGGPLQAANAKTLLQGMRLLWLGWELKEAPLAPPARDSHAAFAASFGILVFGGKQLGQRRFLNDLWVLDVATGRWAEAASASGEGPAPRAFNADGGAGPGGVLRDGLGREWLVIFGGLRGEGFRDNETWALGPLVGGLEAAAGWQWRELQGGSGAQSRERPTPRFHHTQTVLRPSTLAVVGGHNFMVRPILGSALLSFDVGEGEGLEDVRWRHLDEAEGAPEARAYHAAAEFRQQLVLFGGEVRSPFNGYEVQRDTWLLDLSGSWRRLNAEFPVGRSRASAAVVSDRFLCISGGYELAPGRAAPMVQLQICADLWMLDLLNPDGGWSKACDTRRSGRLDAMATVLHDGKTLLIFGGHDGSQLNEFGDPTGGYAPASDTLGVRFRADGTVVTARYAGETAGNQSSFSALVASHSPERVVALGGAGADDNGDRRTWKLSTLQLCWQAEEVEHLDALQTTERVDAAW